MNKKDFNTLTENQYTALQQLRDCPLCPLDNRTGKALSKKGFAEHANGYYQITERGMMELAAQESSEAGTLYILRLSEPLNNTRRDAFYYLGFALNLDGRIWHHRNGTGSKFTRALKARGITFEVVHTMPGTRAMERRIKNEKQSLSVFLQSQGIAI